MTPEEHRAAAKNGQAFFTAESFEVKRPYAQVVRTFQKKAPECLSFALSETRKPIIGVGSLTDTYAKTKPTVIVSGNRTELHFQAKFKGTLGETPPDGNYFLIADAYPVGKRQTRVDIYRVRVELVAQAVRNWASGANMGCPDPTRIF